MSEAARTFDVPSRPDFKKNNGSSTKGKPFPFKKNDSKNKFPFKKNDPKSKGKFNKLKASSAPPRFRKGKDRELTITFDEDARR
jgi:hypothetical protein